MPRLARWSGDSRVSSALLKVIDPERGVSRPMMLFNSVVLPTPLRPRRQTTCPGGTWRCTSHNTWLSPYDTFRSLMVSIDVVPSTQIDFDNAAIALHHVHGALTQDTALMQHRDPLRRLTHKLHVVLYDQHGVMLRQPLQELASLLTLVFGHPGDGLVEEKERRLLDDNHADLEPLHLPMGQRTRLVMRFVEQSQDLQRGGDLVHLLGAHRAKQGRPDTPWLAQGQGEVLN